MHQLSWFRTRNIHGKDIAGGRFHPLPEIEISRSIKEYLERRPKFLLDMKAKFYNFAV